MGGRAVCEPVDPPDTQGAALPHADNITTSFSGPKQQPWGMREQQQPRGMRKQQQQGLTSVHDTTLKTCSRRAGKRGRTRLGGMEAASAARQLISQQRPGEGIAAACAELHVHTPRGGRQHALG